MGKGIVLLWRKVGGENIPRLTGRTGCPNRNSTEEPVPEAGSRYRRGFSFVARLPRTRPGTGQHPGGSLLPHALHQRIGTGAFVPLTGSMDRKAPLYTGNFTNGFCPVPRPSPAGAFSPGEGQPRPVHRWAFASYPSPRPPGCSHRDRVSSARLSTGLWPCTPALARRGIFTGRGSVLPGSAPGFCPVPRPSPAGAFSSGEGQPRPAQLPVNQPL